MLALIFIVILIFLVLAIWLIGKSGVFRSKTTPQPDPRPTNQQLKYSTGVNAYLPVSTWSEFKTNAVNDVFSGGCFNYTAPSAFNKLGDPCLNGSGCLNDIGAAGFLKTSSSCVDPDQVLAWAGQHVCEKNTTGSAGTGCVLTKQITIGATTYYPGQLVPIGAIENNLYVSCGNTACQGVIGVIAPNFDVVTSQSDTNLNTCLSVGAQINPDPNVAQFEVDLNNCDLSDFRQIFRVTRYNLDNDYNYVQDDNGIYAKIVFRANGFYLAPDLNASLSYNSNNVIQGYDYFFDSPIINNNPLAYVDDEYINLILINSQDDQSNRQGIYWLLQDQTPNATVPSEQIDFANSVNCDYTAIPPVVANPPTTPANCLRTGVPDFYKQFTDSGSTKPNPNLEYPISPQQMVYVPNIYLVPKDNSDLIEYWTYLTNQFTIQFMTFPNDINTWMYGSKNITAWNSSTNYEIGDVVVVSSTNYICISANSNKNPPSFSAYWTVIDGTTPLWNPATPYTNGDVVRISDSSNYPYNVNGTSLDPPNYFFVAVASSTNVNPVTTKVVMRRFLQNMPITVQCGSTAASMAPPVACDSTHTYLKTITAKQVPNFLELNPTVPVNGYYRDTQFIQGTSYVTQMFSPVSQYVKPTAYTGSYNPFNQIVQ